MKVLQITMSSKGGAGIAAKRLHEALQENGVKSAFLSTNLTLNFENKVIQDEFFKYEKPNLAQKIFYKIKTILFPNVAQKWHSQLEKLKNELQYEIVSLPFSNFKLHEHPLVKEADVINLHWVGDFIDYPTFFKECQKPIVWTFHDMNPFQGIFHYKNDEVANFLLASTLDAEIKSIKEESLKSISKGVVVTPSQWLLSEVERSKFFDGFDKICIPNSIALNVFKIQDKEKLRRKYHLKKEDFVLLFVADSVKNKRKGFGLLMEALSLIKNLSITVVAVGKGEMPKVDNLKIISLGNINSPEQMGELYSLSDVFVLPSLEDNLPNVMLESLACGTPMIGFEIGGIKEHIFPNFTGLLAEETSAQSLAETITKFHNVKDSFNKERIRRYAEEQFNYQLQSEKYLEAYNKLYKGE